MALNDTRLRSLKPKPGKTDRLVADGNGLYIRIRAGEGKISRAWQFRRRNGGSLTVTTLGNYPELPLLEARQQALELATKGKSYSPTVDIAAEQWLSERIDHTHRKAELSCRASLLLPSDSDWTCLGRGLTVCVQPASPINGAFSSHVHHSTPHRVAGHHRLAPSYCGDDADPRPAAQPRPHQASIEGPCFDGNRALVCCRCNADNGSLSLGQWLNRLATRARRFNRCCSSFWWATRVAICRCRASRFLVQSLGLEGQGIGIDRLPKQFDVVLQLVPRRSHYDRRRMRGRQRRLPHIAQQE